MGLIGLIRRIGLIGLIGLAAFFRFYQLDKLPPGLYADEAMNGNNALEALATGNFKVFYPENFGREGLFINIQALFLKLFVPFFGHEPWILRLPSAVFGTLTVLGVYFLAKELFKRESIALLSSFLIAVSFWHINFSRIGFRAIMAPFFLTWAIYFLLRVIGPIGQIRLKGWIGRIRPIGFAGLAGLVYGLGLHTYIAYRATPLLFFVLFFTAKSYYDVASHRVGQFLIAAVFAFLVALPLGSYFLANPPDFFGRTDDISILKSSAPFRALGLNIVKTLGMFNFAGDTNWRHNYAGRPLLFWPVGLLFLAGAGVGLGGMINKIDKTDRTYKRACAVLLAWFAVAALPVILSNEGLPHALRSVLMAPPVFILAGFGGIWFYEKIRKYPAVNFFSVMFVALLLAESYISYFVLWAGRPEVASAFNANLVRLGRELNSLPLEIPKYVVYRAEKMLPDLQPVMFVTNTYLSRDRQAKNIFYVSGKEAANIPPGSVVFPLP